MVCSLPPFSFLRGSCHGSELGKNSVVIGQFAAIRLFDAEFNLLFQPFS